VDTTAAITAIIGCALITTAFKYQSFTRSVARSIVGPGPGTDIAPLQGAMTPAWIGALLASGYVLSVFSAFAGFLTSGWVWLVVVVLLVLVLPGLLVPIWPFPARRQLVTWAMHQASMTHSSGADEATRNYGWAAWIALAVHGEHSPPAGLPTA
jgi:hypothetical protein